MKIGITFGGYCPLHQGHLDLIMKAKKENDLTFVVVCGYDNEPRADSLGLTLSTRTILIRNFLESDIVKVISINDTELGIDESMSSDNWKIWSRAVLDKIVETSHVLRLDSTELTWYVAEKSYVHALKMYGFCNEIYKNIICLDKTKNNVSGTKCRENPLKYWNKITQPFRANLTHKILISGTSSEGKTTLTEDIAKYFGLVYSYEKGRDNCKWKTDDQFTVKDFIYNLYEQRKLNEDLINSPANTGILISDTDNMVTLMYAKGYADKNNFLLSKKDYKLLYDLAKAYQATTKWDKIFILKPHEKPIVDDGERYMGDSDYKIRKAYFDNLIKLYDEFGYQYEILDGNYLENYTMVKEYIEGLYEKD